MAGNLAFCQTHNVRYNLETIDVCPICLNGERLEKIRKQVTLMPRIMTSTEVVNAPKLENLAEFKKILPSQVFLKTRKPEVVTFRVHVIRILKDTYHLKFTHIASFLNFDRTTVMHHYYHATSTPKIKSRDSSRPVLQEVREAGQEVQRANNMGTRIDIRGETNKRDLGNSPLVHLSPSG